MEKGKRPMSQETVNEPPVSRPQTMEELDTAATKLQEKILNVLLDGETKTPVVMLIASLRVAEALFEVVAHFDQAEQVRDNLPDTHQEELTKVIAKWVGQFTDAIVRGKERFVEEKTNEAVAGQ